MNQKISGSGEELIVSYVPLEMLSEEKVDKSSVQLEEVVDVNNPGFYDCFIKWSLFATFIFLLLLTIIWDLKRVQTLSYVIHDDHSNYWIDMNITNLLDWYTPLDLCILQLNDPYVNVDTYIQQNCSNYIEENKWNNTQRFCNIGASLGKSCNGPFSSRTYFTKRLGDDHLGDPRSGTLNRALNRIASRNRSVLFIGDGISKQNQLALICEMSRNNKDITIDGNLYSSFVTLKWIYNSKPMKIDIHFIYIRTLKSFLAKFDNSSISSVKTKVISIAMNYSGIVIISNVGAWYNSRDKFRYDIAPFIKWLSSFGDENLIFLRETASQHWNHTNNGYFAKDGNANDGECVALADVTPDLDWRNHDVKMFIENKNLEKYFHIIPFRDMTTPLHNMHPTGPDGKDCTHFCYFPQLWQPIWNELDVQTFNSSKLLKMN